MNDAAPVVGQPLIFSMRRDSGGEEDNPGGGEPQAANVKPEGKPEASTIWPFIIPVATRTRTST